MYIYNYIYIYHYITFIAINSRHPHGIHPFCPISKIMDSNGFQWILCFPHEAVMKPYKSTFVPRSKVGVSPRMDGDDHQSTRIKHDSHGMGPCLGRRSQQWCTTVAKRTVAPAAFFFDGRWHSVWKWYDLYLFYR